MRFTAEERILQALRALCGGRARGVTASDLAGELGLSRNVVSHYLNRLLESGLVSRAGAKPVYWQPQEEGMPRERGAEEPVRAFEDYIGWDGSCREAVERCRTAVTYPPDGLPILLCGASGTGKSVLARQICQYAIECGAVSENAPFVTFNCADYANNPQLLSATLFGYRRGAFTGADGNRDGLIQAADNGFLFLDEVHRLSAENQEKLFVLLDQGRYRPLGENKDWLRAKVRLICATTEDVEQVLLKTFRRRIPVQATLPSYASRPLRERLRIVCASCRREARQLRRDIVMDRRVLACLLSFHGEGNVGALENLIKLSCAAAFHRQKTEEALRLELRGLPEGELDPSLCGPLPDDPLWVRWREEEPPEEEALLWRTDRDLERFWQEVTQQRQSYETGTLWECFQQAEAIFTRELRWQEGAGAGGIYRQMLRRTCERVCGRYGISGGELLDRMLRWFLACQWPESERYPSAVAFLDWLRRRYPRVSYLSDRVLEALAADFSSDLQRQDLYRAALYFLLSPLVDEGCQFHGLIVAHGESTATSIASVANRMCRTFIFEAIDMPMETTADAIIERVNEYIDGLDTWKGLILLADMGSLSRMYTSIKSHIRGDLLIVDNVTTTVALDIGVKITSHLPFKKIAEYAQKGYAIRAQYYEGLALDKNIVISCISGLGIAEKLREIVLEHVDTDRLEVVTMDHHALKQAVDKGDCLQFKNTLSIITTSEISGGDLPILYLPELWTREGEARLWRALSSCIDEQSFEVLKKELFKFFSIEGVSSRLSFLNPKVIIGEVESLLCDYERHYGLRLESFRRLNLFLHISVMIERLLIGEELEAGAPPEGEASPALEDFFRVSQQVFGGIVSKYHINLNRSELTLLYELLLG